MSGQQWGTVIGGAIGAYFGGPAGAQLGMAIGGTIGGYIDPTRINGPAIGDGQTQTATDGAPIAWVIGTATVAGTLVQVGPRRSQKVKDSGGKGGGPEVSHNEAHQDFAILVCESSEIKGSTVKSIIMVEQDGKIVYDTRPGSTIGNESSKWHENVTFYYGNESQQADPTLEATTGLGTTPTYRGSCVVVFRDFNLSKVGDRIPNFRFTVATSAEVIVPPDQYSSSGGTAFPETINAQVGNHQGEMTITYNTYDVPDKLEVWDDGVKVIDTGYRGDPSYQSQLDDALAAKGLPPELIEGPGLGQASYYKTSSSSSLLIKVYGPLDTGWDFSISAKGSTSTSDPAPIPLSNVVTRICIRGGLTEDDIDVADLSGINVIGYPIARQATAIDALQPLLQAHFAYASEYDGKIHFKLYGDDAAVTVSEDDLLEASDANDNNVTTVTRNQETEFPRKITASYLDPAQNYMPVTVSAARLVDDINAIGEQTLAIPVVMAADQAKQAADKALKVAYATLEGTQEYAVPFGGAASYLSLCAGEPLIFRGKRWVIDDLRIGTGVLNLKTRYDRQSAYTSSVQAIPGNAPTVSASPYSGPTTLIAMNLPSLRPQDTYGLYLAAGPKYSQQTSWRGCTVQISYDDQETWVNAMQITLQSVFGAVAVADPFTVDVNGDLVSATDAQIAARANAFAIIHATSTEIGQFKTATEDSVIPHRYAITDVTGGGLGTTEVAAVAGEQFVMLDAVYFIPASTDFAGKTLYLRGVGFGESVEDADIISIVYSPDTTIIHDGGEVI
jgi:hypothetical protein